MTITIIWKDNTRQEAWLSVRDWLALTDTQNVISQGYHASTSPELQKYLDMQEGFTDKIVGMHNPVFDGQWNMNSKQVQS